jgi:hypothetical protein
MKSWVLHMSSSSLVLASYEHIVSTTILSIHVSGSGLPAVLFGFESRPLDRDRTVQIID